MSDAIEGVRLHKAAAEFRLRAIESQLSLGLTLCKIAETQIRYSRRDEAIEVVNKLRHHAETIRFHIEEPNHLPKIAVPGVRKRLEQLDKRTDEIESPLR